MEGADGGTLEHIRLEVSQGVSAMISRNLSGAEIATQ